VKKPRWRAERLIGGAHTALPSLRVCAPAHHPIPRMPSTLGLVHGYGLSGSGSNLWTREILRALVTTGHEVHIVCQESRPEAFDFITRAIAYDPAGAPEELFSRTSRYAGTCTVHRPRLSVLPVYVAPRTPSDYVRAIPDLDDDVIEEYVRANARVMQHVAEAHGVRAFHVNHVVLCSVALQQLRAATGTPYAVLPHGSAIEYVVKKDPRMHAAASGALRDAARVLTLNGEVEQRLRDVFADVPGLEAKTTRVPVGVDTEQFDAAGPDERAARVERLLEYIRDEPRGRTAAQQAALRDRLRGDLTGDALLAALREDTEYTSEAPDADVDERLRSIDWGAAPVVVYVGRLIAAKGAPIVVAAFARILESIPDARLVIAGTGGLREPMEALVWALASGEARLAREIARLGTALEGYADPAPFAHLEAFFDRLDREDGWPAYLEAAKLMAEPGRVVFTGFMDHGPLSQLYAIADVGLFPSVVKEASPLVVPESAASGTLPIGTDHAGMLDSLTTLGASLPEDARALLTARLAPEHTVTDFAAHAAEALRQRGRWTQDLRRAAVERYDWRTIAARLAAVLDEMAAEAP
jgi:glycosyltransferase involved in cell wall biosynthesis